MRLVAVLAIAFAAAACAEKSFVGVSPDADASLDVVIGLGDFQDDDVTGVRIQVAYQANAQTFSLFDDVIPYTLDQPSRDFPVELDIGPCLGALSTAASQATVCPTTVTIDILSGSRVLARDVLSPVNLTPGGTTNAPALGARTATALRLTHQGGTVPNPLPLLVGDNTTIASAVLDHAGTPIGGRLVTWRTSNDAIAVVDANGVITGVAQGNAVVTASTGTGAALLEQSINVAVSRRPAATLIVTPNPATIPVGGTQPLSVEARDDQNNVVETPPVTWESLNLAVAVVSSAGVVTGVSQGSATIVARSTLNTGVFGQTTVNVQAGARLYGRVRNAQTNEPLVGVTVRATRQGNSPIVQTTTTGGVYDFPSIPGGTYTVEVLQTGFRTQTVLNLSLTTGPNNNATRVDADLPPAGSDLPFGAIAGRVTRLDGTPVAGATVSLSGGEQTNGVFRATTTATDGTYTFAGIVLEDFDGFPIANFTVIAEAPGLDPKIRSTAIPEDRVIPNFDLALPVAGPVTTFFSDGFETPSGWTVTGMWNRSTLLGISNNAYPTYVRLAPDDASNGALPAPRTGSFAFWFGSPQPTGTERGNFLGQHVGALEDDALSGGTSVADVTGTLTSPFFTLPSGATRVTLRFDAWFEIESVSPNQDGFDIMDVGVKRLGDNFPTLVHRLNPFESPTLGDRDAIPYTSGGFNRAPIWRTVEVDLSEYVGQQIQLVFLFDSVDELYNGFRGWIVDNVSVSDRVLTLPAAGVDMMRVRDANPPQRKRGR